MAFAVATLALVAGCDSGADLGAHLLGPGSNQAPIMTGVFPPPSMTAGDTATFDLGALFTDPDGDVLTYSATSANSSYLTVLVEGVMLTISALAAGTADVVITATDPGRATVTLNVQVVVVSAPPEFASASARLVRNWAVVRYVDWERPVAGAEIEVCYTSGGGCLVQTSHSEDRYLMKELRWGESFTLRVRPFNDGGYGPWSEIYQYGGSPLPFTVMDNLPLQVLGLPHHPQGEPWSIALMKPGVIRSHRVEHIADSLPGRWVPIPTNYEGLGTRLTWYSDGARGMDVLFGGHRVHFLIEYDEEGTEECMREPSATLDPALDVGNRLALIGPHIGRLPLALLQQVDTIRLTNESNYPTDAWTSGLGRRRRFIGVNCLPHWEEELRPVEWRDDNGNVVIMPARDSEFEEILLHELGHILPMPGYGDAHEADVHRSRAAGEPHWFVSEYAMFGTHAEPPTETLSAWFILRYAGQRVAGDGSMVSWWGWGVDDALLESLPNRMAYFDSLFATADMFPYMCVAG